MIGPAALGTLCALILALSFAVAFAAADSNARTLSGDVRFWVALIAVQVLWVAGHAASSLPQWAQWLDDSGEPVVVRERRLKIVQGAIVSGLAGNIAYYGGYYYINLAEVACFISAAIAAYGGDRFLTPILGRITGRITPPVSDTPPAGPPA